LSPARVFNDGTDVYVVVRDDITSDLYLYTSTTDGVSYGARTVFFTGTVAAANVNLSIDAIIYQRGSNFVIPYIVNDNGTLKYNEYTVRTSGPAGYTLPADKGTFTLSGVTTILARARKFSADAGVFALAGSAASLRKGYTQGVTPGAVALAGQATALRVANTGALCRSQPAHSRLPGRLRHCGRGGLSGRRRRRMC